MDYYDFVDNKKISAISLGTMTNLSKSNLEENLQLYIKAIDFGINSFDTAPNYLEGFSDIFIGKLLKKISHENLIISSKVYFPNTYSSEKQGLSKKHIINSLEGSLKTLGIESLDILYCHRFDINTPVVETIETIGSLLKLGKIKSWAISSFSISQIIDFYFTSTELNIPQPKFAQYAYNLFNRSVEKEIGEVLNKLGIKLITYYPLAQGVLTGKYSNKQNHNRSNDPDFVKSMWDLTPNKIEIAEQFVRKCNELQIDPIITAYKWCLRNNSVSSVITNIRNEKQLSNLINNFSLINYQNLNVSFESIFKNEPIDQYTGLKYNINERTL